MAGSGIPLSEWSGSGAVRELQASIEQFNAAAKVQTDSVIRLTKRILVLTGVMTIAVLVQIVIALA